MSDYRGYVSLISMTISTYYLSIPQDQTELGKVAMVSNHA